MSLLEWKQLETVIFSSKVTFITMRTTIEYMQLCHIHLNQKIARKKVARVNAALSKYSAATAKNSFHDFDSHFHALPFTVFTLRFFLCALVTSYCSLVEQTRLLL